MATRGACPTRGGSDYGMARPSFPVADRLHGQPEDGSGYMSIAVIVIDLGKNRCSLAVLDASGAVIQRRRMRPENIPWFTKKLPACTMAMEACCGAHHLGRLLLAQGHQVRLMSPEYVRP